jgi:hypothetical protein
LKNTYGVLVKSFSLSAFLATNIGIMLDVNIARILLDGYGGLTLIEH